MEGAKRNKRLLTRPGAAEELPGVTEESLKNYELGFNRPPNVVVSLMADAYETPELILRYCAEDCPLGKNCRTMEKMPAERTLLRLENTMDTIEKTTKRLGEIMDDGKISEEEAGELPEIREAILELKRRADESLVMIERAISMREFL